MGGKSQGRLGSAAQYLRTRRRSRTSLRPRDHAALGKRLLHTDRQLETLRDHIAEKRGAIVELQAEVDVVRPTHDQLLTYSEELFEIQLAEERREAAEVDEHDPKTRREANLWDG